MTSLTSGRNDLHRQFSLSKHVGTSGDPNTRETATSWWGSPGSESGSYTVKVAKITLVGNTSYDSGSTMG